MKWCKGGGRRSPSSSHWQAYNWYRGLSKHPPKWLIRIEIMKRQKWDYWTYRRQPLWIIRDCLAIGDRLATLANGEAQWETFKETRSVADGKSDKTGAQQ